MLCGMISGTGSKIFCRDARAMLGSRLRTTGCLSKPFSIAIAPASPGGAGMLLPQMQADTTVAEKCFDADERVIEPLRAAGKNVVIPPKSNRKNQRAFDKEMYKARHLIQNFYCKLKQYRAIATRYDKTARNFLAGIHLAAAVIWLN